MQQLDEIIQCIHETANRKLHNLALKVVSTNRTGGPSNYGVFHMGVLITPYRLKPEWTYLIIRHSIKISDEALPYANSYVELDKAIKNDSKMMKQLLGVLFVICNKDEATLFRNLPPALVNRLVSNRSETPEELQYTEAKENSLFWNQYQKHFIDRVHFIFGSELVM